VAADAASGPHSLRWGHPNRTFATRPVKSYEEATGIAKRTGLDAMSSKATASSIELAPNLHPRRRACLARP
jgi:hypothetical protein